MTDTPRDNPPPESLLGRVIKTRYRVREMIGQGGMGVVYEVEHLPSGKLYALKTLPPKAKRSDEDRRSMVARFQREAKAASLLDHPHIVEVLDMGALAGGTLYLVMELVRGRLLSDLIDRRRIGPRRALVITRQILDALDYAHELGMVHRDLKPDNVMVMRAGEPGQKYDVAKLFDFGLVKLVGGPALDLGDDKLTRTGIVFGTPDYMSPEQAMDHEIDGRTDLYAVGLVLYEMLTGRNPFYAPSAMEVMHMQVSTPPPPLHIVARGAPWCTRQVQSLVLRALEKDPDDRFATARTMIAALDEAFESLFPLPAEA